MTTATATQLADRAKSEKWRKANKASAAAKARRYAAKRFGEAVQCARLFCHNRTRHETGLCWRHRDGRARA